MTPDARQRAEFLAREVARLMDMGVPKHLPFETWLADYFMRFAQEELRREEEAGHAESAQVEQAEQAIKMIRKLTEEVMDLRTRLAEAESERDHASMQAGINADLVHKAEQRGRAQIDQLLSFVQARIDGPVDNAYEQGMQDAMKRVRNLLTPGALSAPPPGVDKPAATMLGQPISIDDLKRISKDGP